MALWTPADLGAALSVWLKGDAVHSGLADGDPVAQWDDSSGNSRHAVQATAGNKPTYQTGELNSLPVVRFDGSNDFLFITDTGLTAQPWLIAYVTAPVTVSADQTVWATTSGGIRHYLAFGTEVEYVTNLGADGDMPYAPGMATAIGSPVVLIGDGASGSGDTMTVNGRSLHILGTHDTGTPTNMNLGIAGDGTSDPGGFDLAEFLIVSGAVASGDRLRIEGYLAWKYDLLANFSPTHRYASHAPVAVNPALSTLSFDADPRFRLNMTEVRLYP